MVFLGSLYILWYTCIDKEGLSKYQICLGEHQRAWKGPRRLCRSTNVSICYQTSDTLQLFTINNLWHNHDQKCKSYFTSHFQHDPKPEFYECSFTFCLYQLQGLAALQAWNISYIWPFESLLFMLKFQDQRQGRHV